ncbi:glutathione S-transferase N-terminal domain-containing protein [Rhodopila sp.]|uniref:glutathione S-transferase N-terminal domain-containing protein n=1 Tax=Rhodopila sp. TaxID=2480087 RepID=UPI003D138C6F
MLKVWGRLNSFNVQKVMWLVDELKLAHQHIPAGGDLGGLDAPDFLTMNPHGRVPVIKDGDLVTLHSDFERLSGVGIGASQLVSRLLRRELPLDPCA